MGIGQPAQAAHSHLPLLAGNNAATAFWAIRLMAECIGVDGLEIDPLVVDVPLKDQQADGSEEEPFPDFLAGVLLAHRGLHFQGYQEPSGDDRFAG